MGHRYIIIFHLTSLIAFSKPYYVDIDKTLKTGKFFGEVVVLKYVLEMDSLKYRDVKSMTVKVFGIKDSVFTITKTCPSDYWAYLIFKTYDPRMNCYWPSVGDTVLLALDSTYSISFFGQKENKTQYKLFTPFSTGSATILLSKTLFLALKWNSKKIAPVKNETGAYKYIWGLYATKEELLAIKRS
jgi:hypothetical protein